jgi:hypothetical protein
VLNPTLLLADPGKCMHRVLPNALDVKIKSSPSLTTLHLKEGVSFVILQLQLQRVIARLAGQTAVCPVNDTGRKVVLMP